MSTKWRARSTARFGKIDILVNCAGVWIPGQTLLECPENNWDKVIDVNLKGTYLCCQIIGRVMVKQRSGNIINISSKVGIEPGTGAGAYSISKAGIIMMTRQLALELAPSGIRVNALAPGIVKTDFNKELWQSPDAGQTAGAHGAAGQARGAGRCRPRGAFPRFRRFKLYHRGCQCPSTAGGRSPRLREGNRDCATIVVINGLFNLGINEAKFDGMV